MENNNLPSAEALEITYELIEHILKHISEIMIISRDKILERNIENNLDAHKIMISIATYYPAIFTNELITMFKSQIKKGYETDDKFSYFKDTFVPDVLKNLTVMFDSMLIMAEKDSNENKEIINEMSAIMKEKYPKLADLIDETQSGINKYLDKGNIL
ncbi:MAG: hypothetical protein WC679_13220 [Bacteroidales bacterium]|jgi:hypothetical protein